MAKAASAVAARENTYLSYRVAMTYRCQLSGGLKAFAASYRSAAKRGTCVYLEEKSVACNVTFRLLRRLASVKTAIFCEQRGI